MSNSQSDLRVSLCSVVDVCHLCSTHIDSVSGLCAVRAYWFFCALNWCVATCCCNLQFLFCPLPVLSTYNLNADRKKNLKGNTVLLLLIVLCIDFPCPGWIRRFITMCTGAHYMIIPWHSWHQIYFFISVFVNEVWTVCGQTTQHHILYFILSAHNRKNHVRCVISILCTQQEKNIFPYWTLLHP
jgi:hypothetical protein